MGKWLDQLYERIDDSLNPIVVKELKQASRGHFLIGIMLIFLVVQLTVVGLPMLEYAFDTNRRSDIGHDIFYTLFMLLLTVCVIVIPAYTGYRMAGERSEREMDLMFITTLSPKSLIRGKFLSAMFIGTLIYSTCLPFMTMTYFLRGIDIPTILLSLICGYLGGAFAVQVALLISCVPAYQHAKIVLNVLTIILLVSILAGTVNICEQYFFRGIIFNTETLFKFTSWGLVAVLVLFFCEQLSIAFISPASVNKAYAVRKYMVFMWLTTFIIASLACCYNGTDYRMRHWIAISAFVLSIAYFVVVCERDFYSYRVRAEIPTDIMLRVLVFPLYSGAVNGILWTTIMAFLTCTIGMFALLIFKEVGTVLSDHKHGIIGISGYLLYSYCYALTANFIRRTFLKNIISYENTWLVSLVLIVLGFTVLPILVALLLGATFREVYLLNPFVALDSDMAIAMLFVSIWALVITLLSLPWFKEQIAAFKPVT